MLNEDANAKCECSQLKSCEKNTPFITLTNNYAHAIMKQKKAKTDYLRGLSVCFFVFVYVNKLSP